MTGEITLTGRVMAIGGLREKSMAAYREKIGTVFIPDANAPDLKDVDDAVKEKVMFVPVKYADEVIRITAPTLKSVSWQSSQLALYSDPIYKLERQHPGLNTPDGELYMPAEGDMPEEETGEPARPLPQRKPREGNRIEA